MRAESKAKWLWGQVVRIKGGFRCQMCGEFGGNMHAHHIAGRGGARVIDVVLGILLCEDCHYNKPNAPHKNKGAFLEWLEINYPQKYQRYLEVRNAYMPARFIDWKEETQKMAEICEAEGVMAA